MANRIALVALVFSSLGAGTAFAECSKDIECKGDRICVDGTCTFTSETPNVSGAITSAPQTKNAAEPARLVLATDPLQTLVAAASVTLAGAANGVPASFFYVPLTLEYVASPYVTIGIGAGIGLLFIDGQHTDYMTGGVGARYFPWGAAPSGFWLAGQYSVGTFLPNATTSDVLAGLGYNFVFGPGVTVGLGVGVSAASLLAGNFPVTAIAPIGFAF